MWKISLLAQRTQPAAPADAIYMHGDIVTGESLSSTAPQRVAALAVQSGIIIAVGSDVEILRWRGRKTEVTDLEGAFVIPGFNDSQVHLGAAASARSLTTREDTRYSSPDTASDKRRKALELAIQDAIAQGITSVQDLSLWEDFLIFEQMEREGKLPLRINESLSFTDPLPLLLRQRAHRPADDPKLRTGMLKGILDGSLGSRTAALRAPYMDDPGSSGIPHFDQATLNHMTIEHAAAGFQIGFHAVGDRAVDMALTAFDAAETTVPTSTSLRFRIEHNQVVDPRDFWRYSWLSVIASMRPNHLLSDMHWAEDRIGPERAKVSYPWRQFVNQGTVLAFGTDYPFEPITPFRGLYAAVTRRSEDGTHSYIPDQALTINQALWAYTQASAFAENMETKKGRLLPGYFADLVVLDRDLLQVRPADLLSTQVLRTVVAGRTVFDRVSPTVHHAESPTNVQRPTQPPPPAPNSR